MGKAIGIDLGTTNSVACVMENGKPRVILNPHHEELMPSVVGCEKFEDQEECEIQVGRPAVNQAKLFPRDTIYSAKRIIGRPFAHKNVQRLKELVTYAIVESTQPVKGLAAVQMGGKEYLPEDISARVLAEIKRYSELALGQPVTHAVITVPAYFGEPEKAATREAGRKAGLVVKRLLPEPTAAALAFGAKATNKDGSFVLVYDLGGGTFDISIISVVGQDYNVLEVYGDQFLGGDDFDQKIVEMLIAHVKESYGADLSQDHRFLWIARREAEEAKKRLSTSEATNIVVPEVARVDGRDINIKLRITREQFETAIKSYVDRSIRLTGEALDHQSLSVDDITDVLMVGGSTAVPMVNRAVEALFGADKIRRDVNPMHCVAIGAGILADRMKGIECPNCQTLCDESNETCSACGGSLSVARAVTEGMAITEITTNHFGLQAVSGDDPNGFTILVQKGTEIPMTESKSATLYTTEEGQDVIRVPIFEGLKSNVLDNSRIGVIEYALPERLPKNHPVHIALRLDRQSIVTVNIEVEGFGFSHEQALKRDLVDEESIDDDSAILDDDEEEAPEGERNLALLENLLGRARHFREEHEQILTVAQRNRLDRGIKSAQAIVDGDLGDQAKQEVVNLQQLMMRCGAASLLDQAQIAANTADEKTATEIQDVAEQLREAALAHRDSEVLVLSEKLGRAIRLVFQRAQEIEPLDTAKGYGHLLRDKRDVQ